MKSILFSALAIVALASTGCALQSGGSANLCGEATCAPCTVMSGDCNCGERRQLKADCRIFTNLSDGNGLTACGKQRRSERRAQRGDSGCGCGSAEFASSGSCGCAGGDTYSIGDVSYDDCGCGSAAFSSSPAVEQVVYQEGFGETVAASSGCSLFGKCRSGKFGLGKGGVATAAASRISSVGGIGSIGGCGVPGCGHGNRFCSSCLSKLAGGGGIAGLAGSIPRPGQQPYGGAIPHTAQGPGAGTGTAPSYAYPYYTTRGPRDFLMKKPPSIGY